MAPEPTEAGRACRHDDIEYRFERLGGHIYIRRWLECPACGFTHELPNDLEDALSSPQSPDAPNQEVK